MCVVLAHTTGGDSYGSWDQLRQERATYLTNLQGLTTYFLSEQAVTLADPVPSLTDAGTTNGTKLTCGAGCVWARLHPVYHV